MAHQFTAQLLVAGIVSLSFTSTVLAQEAPLSMPVETKSAGSEPAAGVLLGERMQVLQKIMKAKQEGCGVTGYMSAFTDIQEGCKSGQPEGPLKERLQSLSKAVDEQLERSKVLKTQRLPPAPMNAGPGPGAAGAKSAGGSQGMDQLMAKYGNKLPPDLNKQALLKRLGEGNNGNLNADDLMKKFSDSGKAKDAMDNPKVREMLEKLKSGNGL